MVEKAFFLDRDGCLIEEENYLCDPDKVRLCTGAPEALRKIREAGYRIVMTSNQSGVARGYFTMKEVFLVEHAVEKLLAESGAPVPDRWYYCPHHPSGTVAEYAVQCTCRKPGPGMLLRAAEEMDLDLASSVMIGDKLSDAEAAFRAGCPRAALVLTGHGKEQDLSALPENLILSGTILEAAELLLKTMNNLQGEK